MVGTKPNGHANGDLLGWNHLLTSMEWHRGFTDLKTLNLNLTLDAKYGREFAKASQSVHDRVVALMRNLKRSSIL